MHISKNDIPIKVNAPGAVARQKPDFGDATGYGKVGKDAEIILFSPQHEHTQVLDHINNKLGA